MAEPIGGRLSEAYRQTYESAGVSQLDIAEALDVDQPTVSKWARGMRRPPLDALPVTERLAGVPRGTILRLAGYVDDVGSSVEEAIQADPGLSAEDKRTFLHLILLARARYAQTATPESYDINLDDLDEVDLWSKTTYTEAERWRLIQELRDIKASSAHRNAV